MKNQHKYKYVVHLASQDVEQMRLTTFGCPYPITFETKGQQEWFIRELKKEMPDFDFVDGVLYEIDPAKTRQYFWIEDGGVRCFAKEDDND